MFTALVVFCCSTAFVTCVAYYIERCRRKVAEASIADIKRALDLQVAARSAERTGRIRVEKKLRELLSAPLSSAAPEGAFPFQPIGYLQSCFSQRNGTPRQPLLACNARAKLVLRPDIPVGCLEGLEQYSHVWILFVFHCNTDLQRLWSPSHAADGLKAKVQVPRLNGGRMGVLATRSPHRPAPIGLSVAEVIAVKGRTLIVGGADIVDGSPVLDVKPYLPFGDSIPSATAPSWVSDNLPEDALCMAEVTISEEVTEQLERSWAAKGGAMRELYPAFEEFLDLFRQVLSRDVRSLHQRFHGGGKHASFQDLGLQPTQHAATDITNAVSSAANSTGKTHLVLPRAGAQYQLVLQGIRVWYSITESKVVQLQRAEIVQNNDLQQ